VTCSDIVEQPSPIGVPVIDIVALLLPGTRTSPDGREPDVVCQVYGGTPPDAVIGPTFVNWPDCAMPNWPEMAGGWMIVVIDAWGQQVAEPTGQQGPPALVQSSPVKVLAKALPIPGGACTITTPSDADWFEVVVATITSCQGLHGCVAFEPVAGAV
jgi:hypothetical protein